MIFSGKTIFSLQCLILLLFASFSVNAQDVPTPKEHYGFNIGDDYHLTNYTRTEAYFKKLDEASGRVRLEDIGETEEGRRQYMLVITSPDNMKNLETYRAISRKMALAEMNPDEADKLSKEGKAVVWIDGGLHSTETVSVHQLIETAYQLASRKDPETLEILDKVIVLLVHANPDGHELVGDWYMRNDQPEKRSTSGLPRLYQKYIGHDNNRDFYMFNMKESQNMGRQLFVEWMPQVVYNHHQSGPAGTVLAGPPYRDPFNYVFDPILVTSLDALGAAMHTRLNVEGKPGYTQRGGSGYSTWWNGGLRTSTYFHNMIGILTEIIGNPTPSSVPVVLRRLVPSGDTPHPVLPQKWHFRQSIDYSVSLNYAVMKYAARHTDEMLFNMYRMGRNSIEKGSRNTWSHSPSKVEAITAAFNKEKGGEENQSGSGSSSQMTAGFVHDVISRTENLDPYGYVIPSDQPDFPTAVKFLNALIRAGITVHQAPEAFTIDDKTYPAGSYVVKTAQAFRPHVLDMFEPQDHPNDFRYEGGPPVPPYDAAGWTLAYLMNVRFDRILKNFSVPLNKLELGKLIDNAPVEIPGSRALLLPAKANNSFIAVNELLREGMNVYRDQNNGDFYVSPVRSRDKTAQILTLAGVQPGAAGKIPGSGQKVQPARIGMWDRSNGSIPAGWLRWMLEHFRYDFSLVLQPELEKGDLNDKYDVLIFVGGAIPSSANKTIPQLKKFLENGGKVVTIGSSANLARHLEVPVSDALTELVGGTEKSLPREKYFIPGSVLRVRVAPGVPATWGMEEHADVYFSNNPVFRITSGGYSDSRVEPLMWFDTAAPLRSGWAYGQSYLKDGIAAFKVKIGQGELYVFGPEITFRAQTHGTFRMLFNQLYR